MQCVPTVAPHKAGATDAQLFVGDILREGGEGVLKRAMEGADALVRGWGSGLGGAELVRKASSGRGAVVMQEGLKTIRKCRPPEMWPRNLTSGPIFAGHCHFRSAQDQPAVAGARPAGQAVPEGGCAPHLHLQGGPGKQLHNKQWGQAQQSWAQHMPAAGAGVGFALCGCRFSGYQPAVVDAAAQWRCLALHPHGSLQMPEQIDWEGQKAQIDAAKAAGAATWLPFLLLPLLLPLMLCFGSFWHAALCAVHPVVHHRILVGRSCVSMLLHSPSLLHSPPCRSARLSSPQV